MKTKTQFTPDFLYATPSSLRGVARLMDFSGTFDIYNSSATEAEADRKAMYSDWMCIGEAFRAAIQRILPNHEREQILSESKK